MIQVFVNDLQFRKGGPFTVAKSWKVVADEVQQVKCEGNVHLLYQPNGVEADAGEGQVYVVKAYVSCERVSWRAENGIRIVVED